MKTFQIITIDDTGSTTQKPKSLGYYKVQLRKGSPLHDLYKMDVITARYIERTGKKKKQLCIHRFFDLPRPNEGVDAWEFVSGN